MIHVGLGNFVWCNECEIDNLCLASDREDFGKDSGAVGRVHWSENNFDFEFCPISQVTFGLDNQKHNYFRS